MIISTTGLILAVEKIVFIVLLILTLRPLIKGSPFLPTPMPVVRKILKNAHIKKGDVVYDLGCGDGRFVCEAAKHYQARAIGIELSPILYVIAILRKWITRSPATIRYQNYKTANIQNADIVITFLLPARMKELAQYFQKHLKPQAQVISYGFIIPGWKPAHVIKKVATSNYFPIYFYNIADNS